MPSLMPHEDRFGPRLKLEDLPALASLAQTAKVMGLSVSQVRQLIRSRRLEHILVGRRPFVPKTAIPRFIAENTVQPCHDETPAPSPLPRKAGLFLHLLDRSWSQPGAQHGHVRSPTS